MIFYVNYGVTSDDNQNTFLIWSWEDVCRGVFLRNGLTILVNLRAVFWRFQTPKLRTHGGYLFCVCALLQKKGGKQASGWIDCQFVLGKRGNTSQDLTLLNQCFTVIPNISFFKSARFDMKNHPQDFHPKIFDSLPSNSTSSASLKHPMTISTTFGMFSPPKKDAKWSSKSILPLAESIRSEVNGYEVLPNLWRWDPRSSSLMIARRHRMGQLGWCWLLHGAAAKMADEVAQIESFWRGTAGTSQPFAKIHVQVHSHPA